MQPLFIGVDGGATKVVLRVEDESGKLLGQETGGPANIRISVTQAWQSINSALEKILRPLDISLDNKQYFFHAGMGIAGCEIAEAYQAFLNHHHAFNTLVVTSDAHTACLGAHAGADGAIIIIGTGVVGYEIQSGRTAKVGGWGFPHDDIGSGAWLGLEAVKIALQWLDRRQPVSGLASAVYTFFNENHDELVAWANRANSTAFAELAPLVIQQSQLGDPIAINLLKQSAQAIDKISLALDAARGDNKSLSCALIGGLAPFIQPYLSEQLQSRLVRCQSTPDAGAVYLVRAHLAKKNSINLETT